MTKNNLIGKIVGFFICISKCLGSEIGRNVNINEENL